MIAMKQEDNTNRVGSDAIPRRARERGLTRVLGLIGILLFMLSNASPALSQDAIRFVPRSLTVSDDSVRIDLTIRARGFRSLRANP